MRDKDITQGEMRDAYIILVENMKRSGGYKDEV
jgi:hypothetical protein